MPLRRSGNLLVKLIIRSTVYYEFCFLFFECCKAWGSTLLWKSLQVLQVFCTFVGLSQINTWRTPFQGGALFNSHVMQQESLFTWGRCNAVGSFCQHQFLPLNNFVSEKKCTYVSLVYHVMDGASSFYVSAGIRKLHRICCLDLLPIRHACFNAGSWWVICYLATLQEKPASLHNLSQNGKEQ